MEKSKNFTGIRVCITLKMENQLYFTPKEPLFLEFNNLFDSLFDSRLCCISLPSKIFRRNKWISVISYSARHLARVSSICGVNPSLEFKYQELKKSFLKLAKLHARIVNLRADFSHKLTTQLCRENQAIVIEDLKDRYWTCGNCGSFHDRDVNAAVNLKRLATETALPVASYSGTNDTEREVVLYSGGEVTSARHECGQ